MVNSFLKSDEISRILRDFYSRPYARGDIFTPEGAAKRTGISTHAPTRGATIAYLVDERHLKISTPAPTRGTTAIFHKTTS